MPLKNRVTQLPRSLVLGSLLTGAPLIYPALHSLLDSQTDLSQWKPDGTYAQAYLPVRVT